MNRIIDPFKLVDAIRQGKYRDEPEVVAFAREWYKYWMGFYPDLAPSDEELLEALK